MTIQEMHGVEAALDAVERAGANNFTREEALELLTALGEFAERVRALTGGLDVRVGVPYFATLSINGDSEVQYHPPQP